MAHVKVVFALATSAIACSGPSPTGYRLDSSIREPSGIVASARYEGVLWTHSDSGSGNWLFAVDRDGSLIGRLRVENVENVDWEDIARDDRGNLWIGDIGNNASDRRDLAVHRIPEPDPRSGLERVRADLTVEFRYSDQTRFGQLRADFDAEALMWWDGHLWLLTKHRSDGLTTLYRFPILEPPPTSEVVLEPLATFDLGERLGTGYPASAYPTMSTAADAAPDAGRWALLSYDAVFVFDLPSPGSVDLFGYPVGRIALDPSHVRQIEGLTFEVADLLLINETRAMFRVDHIGTRSRYP